MQPPPQPVDEKERLRRLYGLRILDTPPEERFDRYTRVAKNAFNVPIALVSLIDADRQWFKSKQGLEVSETPREVSFCSHAILNPGLFVVEDTTLDSRFRGNPLVEGPPNIRFYAACPIPAGEGSALGTLCIIDTKARVFTESDRRLLTDLGEIVAEELLTREMATQDELTGALNRQGFMTLAGHAVESAKRQASPLTVAIFDVDDFKTINDSFGHSEGDQALKAVASTLQSSFRTTDVVGRLGGDEFCVLLVGATEEDAKIAVESVRMRLEHSSLESGAPYDVTCSVGFAEYDPAHDAGIADLLKQGDVRMYSEKRSRRRQGPIELDNERRKQDSRSGLSI